MVAPWILQWLASPIFLAAGVVQSQLKTYLFVLVSFNLTNGLLICPHIGKLHDFHATSFIDTFHPDVNPSFRVRDWRMEKVQITQGLGWTDSLYNVGGNSWGPREVVCISRWVFPNDHLSISESQQHHSRRTLILQYSGVMKNSKNSRGRLW